MISHGVQREESTLDYRSMVNPTYLTAQSTLLMLAASGNADAQEFIREMGIQEGIQRNQDQSKPSPISEADRKALMVGASLAVEARYAAISRVLENEGYKSVLDIACGYTPRSLYCYKAGIDYVGMEIPVVAEQMQAFAQKKYQDLKHPAYVGGDATNAASLKAAADLLDGELFISSEGLMQYLSADEAEQFIGGIRQVLSEHGGAWYSSDWNVDYQQFSTRNMTSPEGVKYYNETRRQIMKSSNVFNEGVSFLSEDEKQAFLESHGLKVEKLPFYYGDENLAMLRAVAPDKMDAIMDQFKKSSFWKMTLDPSFTAREKIAGAKEVDNLHIDCSAEGSRLICRIAGRIDTISAPALLEVLEKNGDGFEELSVEAERLEYLSSAGIRVLLMASKKFGKMSIRHASDAVKKIFADSGFDQQISVE